MAVKEEKTIEADKLKAADLRAQHEKHVTELSRITRNKQDAHKLLEELKTKDRIIEQLRKSVARGRSKADDVGCGADNFQMRKLREEVKKTEQPTLLPLANSDPKTETFTQNDKFHQKETVEQNITNKVREQMTCGGTPEEDTDSAVSSAPSPLSPQPCSPLHDDCSPLRCGTGTLPLGGPLVHLSSPLIEPTNTHPSTQVLRPLLYLHNPTPPPGLWIEHGSLGHGHQLLEHPHYEEDDGRVENELTIARRQVRELERALLVTRAAKSSSRHVTALSDRVRQLEEREASLLRELRDLREQNELLLELAECHERPHID